jgi:hypothetical protein
MADLILNGVEIWIGELKEYDPPRGLEDRMFPVAFVIRDDNLTEQPVWIPLQYGTRRDGRDERHGILSLAFEVFPQGCGVEQDRQRGADRMHS